MYPSSVLHCTAGWVENSQPAGCRWASCPCMDSSVGDTRQRSCRQMTKFTNIKTKGTCLSAVRTMTLDQHQVHLQKRKLIRVQWAKSPGVTHLDNSRVTGQSMVWLWRLRHSDVFDVTSSEDYVFKNFILGWHRSVCVPVLCPIGNDWK